MLENCSITYNDENCLQGRCVNFLVSLINEIKQRLHDNMDIEKIISYLSVPNALNFNNKNTFIPLLNSFKGLPNFLLEMQLLLPHSHIEVERPFSECHNIAITIYYHMK